MAKGQMRSNKEVRKPKADKKDKPAPGGLKGGEPAKLPSDKKKG